jgi:hypothetical protein
VLVEHSKRYGYEAGVVPELTQRKQVESLRAFMGLPTEPPNVYRDDTAYGFPRRPLSGNS